MKRSAREPPERSWSLERSGVAEESVGKGVKRERKRTHGLEEDFIPPRFFGSIRKFSDVPFSTSKKKKNVLAFSVLWLSRTHAWARSKAKQRIRLH